MDAGDAAAAREIGEQFSDDNSNHGIHKKPLKVKIYVVRLAAALQKEKWESNAFVTIRAVSFPSCPKPKAIHCHHQRDPEKEPATPTVIGIWRVTHRFTRLASGNSVR